jgi:predicted metal-binding membrane protein
MVMGGKESLQPKSLFSEVASYRRPLFWIGFYTTVLAAWGALFQMSLAAPWRTGSIVTPADWWTSLCIGPADVNPLTLYCMWVLMAAAMMLPTFVPTLRVFGEMTDVEAADKSSMAALVAGYVSPWLLYCAAGALFQVLLSRLKIVAPDGTSQSLWFTSGLLIAAAAYQLTLAKAACLAKCRHPLTFFLESWRPGRVSAFSMGLRLGAYCVGCCWVLMLLGFVGGTMNLLWMGGATLFMTFEKFPGLGRYLTKPAGLLLLAAGCTFLERAVHTI